MERWRAPVLAHQRFVARERELRGLSSRELFTEIWRSNLWGAQESRSGLGSEQQATSRLTGELPALLKQLGVRTLLDCPCGDFGWLSRAELDLDAYLGADIVGEIVALNTAKYATADGRISFRQLDLLTDPLPAMDAVLCRDCLVHLSFANIAAAIANFRRSGSEWLVTTTFPELRTNIDCEDGDWRALNLALAPFNWGPAVHLLVEGCTEGDGGWADKSLAAWRLADLPD